MKPVPTWSANSSMHVLYWLLIHHQAKGDRKAHKYKNKLKWKTHFSCNNQIVKHFTARLNFGLSLTFFSWYFSVYLSLLSGFNNKVILKPNLSYFFGWDAVSFLKRLISLFFSLASAERPQCPSGKLIVGSAVLWLSQQPSSPVFLSAMWQSFVNSNRLHKGSFVWVSKEKCTGVQHQAESHCLIQFFTFLFPLMIQMLCSFGAVYDSER